MTLACKWAKDQTGALVMKWTEDEGPMPKPQPRRAATRPLTSLWTTVRTQLRDARDAHAARASLKRELASYNSESDLYDLYAILDRYSDRETREIRRILAHQHSR